MIELEMMESLPYLDYNPKIALNEVFLYRASFRYVHITVPCSNYSNHVNSYCSNAENLLFIAMRFLLLTGLGLHFASTSLLGNA